MNAEFGPSHQIYLENFSSSIKVKTHSVHVGNILGIQHVLRAQLLFMFLAASCLRGVSFKSQIQLTFFSYVYKQRHSSRHRIRIISLNKRKFSGFMEESLSSSSNTQQQTNLKMGSQKRKAGRKKFQETRRPVYKAVRRRNGKWVSELRQPYKKSSRIWLGTFPSPDMAARAYDVAALALRGDSSSLNFPESAHLLPQVRSTSTIDIQCAALEAADKFQHSSTSSSYSSSINTMDGTQKVEEACNSEDMFLDEEELFNMPALLDSMAEGLILTPPAMKKGFSWNDVEDDDPVNLTLWSD